MADLEKQLVTALKRLIGGKEKTIKYKDCDADRNEFIGTGDQFVDYLVVKNGISTTRCGIRRR